MLTESNSNLDCVINDLDRRIFVLVVISIIVMIEDIMIII